MIQVRPADVSDLSQLSVLFDNYRVFYQKEPDLEAARQFLHARMTKGESTIYIAEEAGILQGFTQLYPIFSSTRMKRLWLLNDLFVDSSQRGKGVSVKLIERAKQLVRDTDACGLMLETGKDNFIGNRLYPKTGFVLNETANFYEWSE